MSLKTKLNCLKITDGGWGGGWESQTKNNWRLEQDTDYTRREMSDKMKIAFQPVVVSKSSKSLPLSHFA